MASTATKIDYEYEKQSPVVSFPAGSEMSAEQPAPDAPAGETTHPAPRKHAYGLRAAFLAGDWLAGCAAIFIGLTAGEWQRTGWRIPAGSPFDLETSPVLWSLAGGTFFSWLMALFRSYRVRNLYRMRVWATNLARSVVVSTVVLWGGISLFQVTGFTPRFGAAYCVATLIAFVGLWRLFSFVFLVRPSVRAAASSRIIVVGWSEKVDHLRAAMRRDFSQLSEIIGCVPMPGSYFPARPPEEIGVLGDFASLPRLVLECHADSVILSESTCPALEIQQLIHFCRRERLGFQLVPEHFPALNSGLQVQTLSGVPLLGVTPQPLDRPPNRLVKRAMDIVGGLLGMIAGAILVPLFALAVYLESPGPVFERQRRTSRGGRTFRTCRLRTNRLEHEPSSEAPFPERFRRLANAPRPLRIGRFMRRFDIDELPQFWNVLIGDMSLVGPCPERPELIERFKDEIPNYDGRHEVRAGLTGLAQIRGLPNDCDLIQRVEADLHYLENWTVMFDLYCIAATFFRLKRPR